MKRLRDYLASTMSRRESEGQRGFDASNCHQGQYNQTTIGNAVNSQANGLMTNQPLSITQNNILQNNAIAMGIVQQQQQMPMIWGGQASLTAKSKVNQPTSSNQEPNQLPVPYGTVASASGTAPLNTSVESSISVPSGSASNLVLALEPTNVSDNSRTSLVTHLPKTKSNISKGSKSNRIGGVQRNNQNNDIDEKTEKNRERNREHARSTRLRKKAYIQKLKDMASGLRAVQTKEIKERRISMQNIMNTQKVRRSVVQTLLDYHATNERDPAKWKVLIEDSFWMKTPVTPFRCISRSEVDGDFRVVRSIDGMISDAASIAVMVERVGCHNARWLRIKRRDFLRTLEDPKKIDQAIGLAQQPESSLSGESSTDSSQCSEIKSLSKRKRSSNSGEDTRLTMSIPAKVSSASESGKTEEKRMKTSSKNTPSKRNISSSDEGEKDSSCGANIGSRDSSIVRPPDSDMRKHETQPSFLDQPNLKNMNTERISAMYAVNQDDMIILDDVLMCPYVFRTKNAILCGALGDCIVPGMLRANFASNNKLKSVELVFDAMGFMQQLDNANGGDSNTEIIPRNLEAALIPCLTEARIITEAVPPYSVVHVNEIWTKTFKYSQSDVEGKPFLSLLIGAELDLPSEANNTIRTMQSRDTSHCLEDVASGRASCSTSLHYKKTGKAFVDFMCSYPLRSSTDQITHLFHVNLELPQTMALVSL